MDILSKITDAMQVVLSETADAIARKTGFIKRQRKLSGSDFAQTLVFGWLDNPDWIPGSKRTKNNDLIFPSLSSNIKTFV